MAETVVRKVCSDLKELEVDDDDGENGVMRTMVVTRTMVMVGKKGVVMKLEGDYSCR